MASTSYHTISANMHQDSPNIVKGYSGVVSVHSEPQLSRLVEREYDPLVASTSSSSRKGKERMVYGDRCVKHALSATLNSCLLQIHPKSRGRRSRKHLQLANGWRVPRAGKSISDSLLQAQAATNAGR